MTRDSSDAEYQDMATHSVFLTHGLIATRAQFEAAGIPKHALDRLVHSERVVRVARNRYVPRGLDPALKSAALLGGRLTSTSLFTHLGAWRPPGEQTLHIAVPRGAHKRTSPPASVRIHWSRLPGLMLTEPHESAVRHLLASVPRDECVAVLDSVIRGRIMLPSEVDCALTQCGAKGREALNMIDVSAGSGVESLMRLWLRRRRIRFRTQVHIGKYYVDFLVGDRLVLEVVGEQYHAGATAFEADGAREAYLQGLGYQVFRVTARQVLSRQHEFEHALMAVIRRRQHVFGPVICPSDG